MKRLTIIVLLLLLLAVPSGAALAAPPFDTVVEEGETINDDIILFDGNLEIRAGATVNGDVISFNGDVALAGAVQGDVVLFNGDLDAADTAVIDGDCVVLNGNVDDETESGLGCPRAENLPNFALPALPQAPDVPARPDVHVDWPQRAGGFFANVAEAAASSLLLGFLAFVVVALLPTQVERAETAVKQKPVTSGAIGLLTAVAVPSLVALLLPVSIILTFVCIGLLGFPIMFVLMVGLAAGALLGWITIGSLVGERLADSLQLQTQNQAVIAAFGTAVLTFAIGVLGALPLDFLEGLLAVMVTCIGLGAVALTQFGTKPYPALAMPRGGSPTEDSAKITAVLETLPDEETDNLKE